MIYLTPEDLKTDSQERHITDSTADTPDVLEKIEKATIGIVSTFLSPRYDTQLVFAEGAPIRDEVLVDLMVKIALYKLFRRNAARKVGTDTKEDYSWAMKQLEKIQSGRITLDLPAPDLESTGSYSMFGNTSNRDFYI